MNARPEDNQATDCLVLDAETRPDPRIWDVPEIVEEIRDGLKPDSRLAESLAKLQAVDPESIEAARNLVDPEKIEADIAKKRSAHGAKLAEAHAKVEGDVDQQLDTMRQRAALDPKLGKVACICIRDLDPSIGSGDHIRRTFVAADEFEVLAGFASALDGLDQPWLLGGYNVREFDVPFITYRCAVNGIDLPGWWPLRTDWRSIVDPCDLFPRGRSGSLQMHLRAMGLPRKTMSGEESLSLSLEDLAAYCANDVEIEAALINRLRSSFRMLGKAVTR